MKTILWLVGLLLGTQVCQAQDIRLSLEETMGLQTAPVTRTVWEDAHEVGPNWKGVAERAGFTPRMARLIQRMSERDDLGRDEKAERLILQAALNVAVDFVPGLPFIRDLLPQKTSFLVDAGDICKTAFEEPRREEAHNRCDGVMVMFRTTIGTPPRSSK